VFVAVAAAMMTARAGEIESFKDNPPPNPPHSIYEKGRWEFSLESAYTFQTIPNPFFALAGLNNKNPLHYRLATQILSARYQLTNPGGPLFLRGTLETSANLVGSVVVHGPESYFIGFALGFRYYFVQPGARLVPYLEVRGGPGQTDSRGFRHAQQQDFTFTYMLGAGLRYDANPHWSATLSVVDQHLSNAYLTNPNYGFDSVGVSVGLIRRF
jgi:hypothetical protein